jgi:nucleoside-diphosphate-sugar epimerase
MKILLTGATGFIGSHVLKRGLNENYQIIIAKRSNSNTKKIKDVLSKVKCYDIDKIPISKIFENNKIDLVIHCATYYKKNQSYEDISEMIDSNITFPSQILEQMHIHNVKYFINTGSFFEYAVSTKKISETQKKEPYNFYASTKAGFSEILKWYSKNCGIKVIELRLFSAYGPGDNEKLFNFLIKNFINQKKFEMSPCEQRWNWTFVEDIADAYARLIKYIKNMKSDYECFNIGNEKTASIKEIIKILERMSGKNNLVAYTKPYVQNEIFYVNCNSKKAQKEFGWKAKHDIKKGIKITYDWLKEEIKNENPN